MVGATVKLPFKIYLGAVGVNTRQKENLRGGILMVRLLF
jgi:hypothetical protein